MRHVVRTLGDVGLWIVPGDLRFNGIYGGCPGFLVAGAETYCENSGFVFLIHADISLSSKMTG